MKIDVYNASDYAGLRSGPYEFYYGYEEVVCKKHKNDFETCSDNDCDDGEWAFIARKEKKEIARYATSELDSIVGEYNTDDCAAYLLAGIALMMSKGIL